ncbi:MAG TPA: NifB/NifX family molybdenum-iron cluster-binding protein [Symbiobacteriaceae bacterium]|jgi:predicted Fe-Mo cluster-binding NifX family protein
MRIAIPVRNGAIFGHFGQVSVFLLADVENGQILRQTEVAVPEQSGHHGLPAFLLEHGVTHVIAGGMGRPMADHLTRSGIPAVVGVTGSPGEALAAFVAGSLQSDPTAVHEHHHGHEGHGGHESEGHGH